MENNNSNTPKIDVGSVDSKKELFTEEALTEIQDKLIKPVLDEEIKTLQKDFLIFFGLFASFMTFLSIEVQVFKNNDNWSELIGISAITMSLVIFFALIINDVAQSKSSINRRSPKRPYILSILLIVGGTALLFFGSKSSSQKRLVEVEIQLKQTKNQTKNDSIKIASLSKLCDSMRVNMEHLQKDVLWLKRGVIPIDSFLLKEHKLSKSFLTPINPH
jgi:hypothetical protein